MKKLERQLQSASTASQSPVTAPVVSRSPVVSRVNGLAESLHHSRIGSSPLKPSLPHSSESSSTILPDTSMLAFNDVVTCIISCGISEDMISFCVI